MSRRLLVVIAEAFAALLAAIATLHKRNTTVGWPRGNIDRKYEPVALAQQAIPGLASMA